MKKLTLMIVLLSSVGLGCKFLESLRGGGTAGG